MLKKLKRFLSYTKQKYNRLVVYLLSPLRRRALTNTDFTIISNNCWGGFIYQRYNLPYKTPFLGMFIPAPCYIDLLENFEQNMALSLRFITPEQSVYYKRIIKDGRRYPIGVLGENIEIHFLHYKTPQEAQEAWQRRKARINLSNMLVKFAEIDCCTPELVERFDKLPFKHKICFTVNNYPVLKSTRVIPHSPQATEATGDYKYIPQHLCKLLNNLRKD